MLAYMTYTFDINLNWNIRKKRSFRFVNENIYFRSTMNLQDSMKNNIEFNKQQWFRW